MTQKDIKAVIFDLGGVLVQLGGMGAFMAHVAPGMERDAFLRRWLYSGAVRRHEAGLIDSETFLDELMAEFGVHGEKARVRELFAGFLTGLYPGADQIFARLRGQVRTGILSNTSHFHWNEVTERFPALLEAEILFLSCEMHLLKPDAAIFEEMTRRLGCDPTEIVFFDDNPDNVEAAKKAGLRACRVDGCMQAVRLLEEFGLTVAMEG